MPNNRPQLFTDVIADLDRRIREVARAEHDTTAGTVGPPGPAGPTGPPGATGPAGSQGPIGPTGSVGPAGPTGPQGPPGTGLAIKGSVPTSADLPASATLGDGWITVDTGHLWVWDGTKWVDAGEMVGPEGPPGPPGDTGPQGPQGAQGPIGPQGETGAIGPTGPTGDQGTPGTPGDPGPEGPEGPEGPAGPVGPPGQSLDITGSVSSASSLPPVGSLGDVILADDNDHLWIWNGTQWVDAGPIGVPGPAGPPGLPGPPGDEGAPGAAGVGVPPGGTEGQALVKASGTDYDTEWGSAIPEGGGGAGDAVMFAVTQTAHGFAIYDCLRLAGGTFVKAQANSDVNADVVGVVSKVTDANVFEITLAGRITGGQAGNTGPRYLSPTTPGALVDTEPSVPGQVSKPVLYCDDPDAYVQIQRGYILPVATTIVPTGSLSAFAGTAAPNGWLVCDGAAVSRTTYAALFAIIGTTWGAGDGSTTFNLPDLRGRALVGRDPTGTVLPSWAASVGGKGGSQTVTLTTAQLPAHNHSASTGSAGSHAHTVGGSAQIHINYPSTFGIRVVQPGDQQVTGTDMDNAGAHTHTVSVGNTGSGAAVSLVQPSAAVLYIIKA